MQRRSLSEGLPVYSALHCADLDRRHIASRTSVDTAKPLSHDFSKRCNRTLHMRNFIDYRNFVGF